MVCIMRARMRANSVHVHLSVSMSLRTQVCVGFRETDDICGPACVCVAPHDSCYDHYDSYFSLCLMHSPPVCLLFVGHADSAAAAPSWFILAKHFLLSCSLHLFCVFFFFYFSSVLLSSKYGPGASGKHHSNKQ